MCPMSPSVEIGTGVQFAATTAPVCAEGVAGGKARIWITVVSVRAALRGGGQLCLWPTAKGYWRVRLILIRVDYCVGGTTGGTLPCNKVYNGVQSLPSSSAVLLYIEGL